MFPAGTHNVIKNRWICVKLREISEYNTHSCVGQVSRIDILYNFVGVRYMYCNVTIDVLAVPEHARFHCCRVHHDIIVRLQVPVHQQNLKNTKRSVVSIGIVGCRGQTQLRRTSLAANVPWRSVGHICMVTQEWGVDFKITG